MAEHGHRLRLGRVGDDLGAFLQHDLRVVGQEADELLAALRDHVGAGERALADEVGLGLADRPGEAGVVGGQRAVGVLADDDVALLGAHHVHRLGAVGHDVVLLAGLPQLLPEGEAVAGGDVDLEAELAGEGDPEEPGGEAGDGAFGDRHVREGLGGDVEALDEGLEELAGVRALQRDRRPLLGGRGEPDLEVGPLGLQVVLHHVEDARGAAGGGGDVEAVGGEAADDAVVADEAVLAEEEAVAAAADAELGPGVGVHPLHEGDGVGADDLDLAEGRGVEDADARRGWRGTRGLTAACMSSPGFGKYQARRQRATGSKAAPFASAQGSIGVLRVTLEGRVLVVAGEGAEGRRRVGRAEGGEPDLRRRLAEGVGGDHQAVDVRHLALVGGHAVGGVALDVLDRAHALADREADVLGGDVVLEVDEGLGLAGSRSVGSSLQVTPVPVRSAVDGVGLRARRRGRRRGGLRAGGGAVGERGGDAPEAAAGAGDRARASVFLPGR